MNRRELLVGAAALAIAGPAAAKEIITFPGAAESWGEVECAIVTYAKPNNPALGALWMSVNGSAANPMVWNGKYWIGLAIGETTE